MTPAQTRDTFAKVEALSPYDDIALLRLLADKLQSFDAHGDILDAADAIERELLADNARANGQPVELAEFGVAA